MGRLLEFSIGAESIKLELDKVDRRKIYGWVEKKAFDRHGKECYMGSISDDGLNIFGKESFEQGFVNDAGEWVEKGETILLGEDGNELEEKESSFKSVVELSETVSVDEYLLYNCHRLLNQNSQAEVALMHAQFVHLLLLVFLPVPNHIQALLHNHQFGYSQVLGLSE